MYVCVFEIIRVTRFQEMYRKVIHIDELKIQYFVTRVKFTTVIDWNNYTSLMFLQKRTLIDKTILLKHYLSTRLLP